VSVDERSLERLFLDNSPFEELASALEVFCPFDAVGMDRQEVRHGYFLRYILDPQRPHGFGAEILRGFMWAAAAALRDDPTTAIRPLDVHLMDLESANVQREYRSIDLLIQIPAERVVIAIELKIDAAEHSGQLGRYRSIIEKEFPGADGWRQLFLFLTKRGDAPSETDGKGWQALPLEAIVEMLERVVSRGTGQPDARLMVSAYVGMLRRNHLTDQRLENLARDLWREHTEVLEFLMTRRPDLASEVFARLLETQFEVAAKFTEACGLQLTPDHSTQTFARFAVSSWDAIPGMLSGTGWKPSNHLLLFEIYRDRKGGIACQFELGPGDAAQRTAIFEALKNGGAEVGGKWDLAPKWRQLAGKTLLACKEGEDADQQFTQLVSNAAQFLKAHVPRYDSALKKSTPSA
jgi:hypothetical protein